jgi:hypothetical protein
MDLVNITGGAIDTSWTSGDFATVKSMFDALEVSLNNYISPAYTLVQYRAYHMAFNADDPGPGNRSKANGFAYAPTGPPRYVLDLTDPHSGTAGMPYQVSIGVTLKTAWPRHWGRLYLPTPSADVFDSNGRITSSARTAYANAVSTLGKALSDADFLPVVPVTDLNRSAFHGLLGVGSYVVDDVPDIQRRRRPRQAANRTIGA